MATKATTVAHLPAVGMAGSDAQVATLLSALGTSDHDDVASFIAAVDAKFVRTTNANGLADRARFMALSSTNELKLKRYRSIWAKVRATATDSTLASEGWVQTSAALTAIGS